MKLNKKEKILILCSLAVIFISFYTFMVRGKILNTLDNNKIFFKSYEDTKSKKYEKEIDRKLESKELNRLISQLSLKKTEIAVSILENKDLVKVLNMKKKEDYSSKKYLLSEIKYEDALTMFNIGKEFQELSVLSSGIKEYLNNRYVNFDYDKVVENNDIPELIKQRNKYIKVTGNEELKDIIKHLNREELQKFSALVENDGNMLNFLNFDTAFINEIKNNSHMLLSSGLSIETLEGFVLLNKKLDKLQGINPQFKEFLSKEIEGVDFVKNYQYGDFYLSDRNNDKLLEKEYKDGNYTFKNPFVKVNPYGRAPLTALIKTEESIADKTVQVTVYGQFESPDYTYSVKAGKSGDFPIIGLYQRTENKVRYTVDGKSNIITINIGQLDNILPAIVIEKRVDGSIEPGMNLVSFNTKEKALPFVFDKCGNIRYLLDVSSVLKKAYAVKDDGKWLIANDEAVFTFDILGRVVSTKNSHHFDDEENWKNGVLFRNVQYLPKTNNQLIVYGFSDKVYPSGVFSELGIDSKQELFKARLYFDKYTYEDNNILSGRRIELFK